jgi:hypothetical protein
MLLIILVLLSIFSRHTSLATDEFKIFQKITYSIDLQGKAHVKQDVSLTNNFSQIYAKEYQINLSGSNIQSIKGNDSNGNIIDKINQQNEITNIFLKFNKPAIGKDQTNQFTIDYNIVDFAKKKGNTWEIQFPVYSANTGKEQLSVTLEIPTSFGELSFSSVPIDSTHILRNTTQIQINQNQLNNKKVLLVFGNHQLFDFKLNYFLENTKNVEINTEIPIPPDTDSQTIILKNIEPAPKNLKIDSDGNWLAQFNIIAKTSINVSVTGQAKIHPPIPIEDTVNLDNLTRAQKYWPTADPMIINIAQNLDSSKQIYQYVVESLNYDYSGINSAVRKGAIQAIENPNLSLCTEFTDLFVALARTKNIPSREIEGFAFSNDSKIKPINSNSDVLHAWPEYYNQNSRRWMQIDPTWEKTTNGIDYFTDLDLNHLAFVIHGQDSEYPPPPGSYKKDKNTKSVFVDFATTELKPEYTPLVLNITGNNLSIKNTNLFSIHSIDLKLGSPEWQSQIKYLLPYSTTVIEIPKMSFFQSLIPKSQQYQITLTAKESSTPTTYRLTNKQHYLNLSICIGFSIFLLCIGGIILTVSFKSNEKNS